VHLARDAQNSADTNQNVFDSFLENFDYADEPPKPAETENTDAVIEADVIETTDVAATQSQPFDSFDTSASVNQVADEEADVQSYSSTDDTWGVASTAVGPDDFQSPSPTFQEDLVGAPQPGAVGTSPVPEEVNALEQVSRFERAEDQDLTLRQMGLRPATEYGKDMYFASPEEIEQAYEGRFKQMVFLQRVLDRHIKSVDQDIVGKGHQLTQLQ